MYSRYNEGKSVVAERFIIRALKNEISKHMTAVSKNVYFDVLNGIVDKYNSTYHRTIKVKPTDINFDSYAEYNVDFDDTDPKFKVGDHARISKHKNIFAKEYAPNWSEEVFIISKIKNTVPWTYVLSDLNDGKIVGTFYEEDKSKRIYNRKNNEKERRQAVCKMERL